MCLNQHQLVTKFPTSGLTISGNIGTFSHVISPSGKTTLHKMITNMFQNRGREIDFNMILLLNVGKYVVCT